MHMKRFITLARVLFTGALFAAATAQASISYNFNGILVDTEFVAGSGANSAMIVLAYPDVSGSVFAFTYQWDGSAKLSDAYNAIETASGGSFYWDKSTFILDIQYTDPDTTTTYNSNSSGWTGSYNTSQSDATGWTSNVVGVYDQDVLDGSWQWMNTDTQLTASPENDWSGPTPNAYSSGIIVPEPSQYALAAGVIGAAFLLTSRRKRASRHA